MSAVEKGITPFASYVYDVRFAAVVLLLLLLLLLLLDCQSTTVLRRWFRNSQVWVGIILFVLRI